MVENGQCLNRYLARLVYLDWQDVFGYGAFRPMPKTAVQPTQTEVTFAEDEIIVSKTDPTGRVTYANDVFLRVAGFDEKEVLGEQHSLVRHPDMPRCVFKLLWDTLATGQEIFAYVKNMTKSGDYYWVFAHATPSFGPDGKIIGYHSNRRLPDRLAISKIEPIYRDLLSVEQSDSNRKAAMTASHKAMVDLLSSNSVTYDQFVHAL